MWIKYFESRWGGTLLSKVRQVKLTTALKNNTLNILGGSATESYILNHMDNRDILLIWKNVLTNRYVMENTSTHHFSPF